ncbi:MAG: ABC-F family ATP-binding cassette domain-containing protein [Pseudomonadota bacterium]
MLHINDLTYRIDGRLILDKASAGIPAGHKVGLVGRNGAGKSTLLKLIVGDLPAEDGGVTIPKNCRIGYVAQEAPGGSDTLIDWVLSADTERADLLAEAETADDPARIAEIQLRLNDIDAHAAPARAAQILAGLGFDEAAQNRACSEFSGGWRMRVALAAVLFLEPELLLLDEPTNYLDLEGALWLENYLRAYPHTVLIVSHDRNLLNRAVSSILYLDRGRLSLYAGGYDDFEDTKRQQQQIELKLKKKQDDERRRIEAFIDRFRAKATKATQAQSRIKALARMQPIAARMEDAVAPFAFPAPAKVIASPLIQIEKAAAGYEPGKSILLDLNLRIDNDDRIALLGQNGNGKSTFAKLISGRLKPLDGKVSMHNKIEFGYFAQHQLDELASGRRPYDYIADLMPEASEAQRRARLGAFGFGVEKANNICGTLSGGEKARLLLMIAAFHGPHVLVLDEPTNHLDVDSRQALIQALNDYHGAVIMISHDRHLIEACAERLWLVQYGTVKPFDGDMDDYRRLLLDTISANKRAARKSNDAAANTAAAGPGRADQRRAAAERRAQLAPLRKNMQAAEKSVEAIAAKLAKLDAELGDSALYARDPERAQKLSIERGSLAKDLEEAEGNWMAAMEAYESAQQGC